jgi:hypothetical protein
MPPRRIWSGLCRLNGDVMRYILEVEKRNFPCKIDVQPISNRQPKLLDFPLTHRNQSTSQFLIDNFGASLSRRPPWRVNAFTAPKHSGAEEGHSPMISNRQCPELEIDLSHRKQRTENFLIAKFRPMLPSLVPLALGTDRSLHPSPDLRLSTLNSRLSSLIANETHSREESCSCKQSTYKILIANENHSRMTRHQRHFCTETETSLTAETRVADSVGRASNQR